MHEYDQVSEPVLAQSIVVGKSRFYFLLAGAAGLTCAAAVAVGLTINWLRADVIGAASRDSSNLAVVLADQISNSIQSIDLILNEIKTEEELRSAGTPDQFDRVSRSEDTHQYLVDRLSHLPQADFISVVDKNGRLVNTTQDWGTPKVDLVDLSDGLYFQHFKHKDDPGLYIGNVLINRWWERNLFLLLNASRAPTAHFSGWFWSASD